LCPCRRTRQAALEESFRAILRERKLGAALDDASDATPYERATALHIDALRKRFAAALRGFDAEMDAQAARLASLRVPAGFDLNVPRSMASLPSALTGAGTDGKGVTSLAWAAEASGGTKASTLLPGGRLASLLAAPMTAGSGGGAMGGGARSGATKGMDARLASRVAAMHRMALRAFAAAAAQAAAPEEHPESEAAMARAAPAPGAPKAASAAAKADAAAATQLRAAPAALRRCGRPSPASRTTLKTWMQAHFFPSAAHPHGPFPSSAEKEALADETGLSVNQVSDWFVNARARWWKPMIEGMHRGLCDADDEPAAALPAVPEGGDGDDEMAVDDAIAAAKPPLPVTRTYRRRASSGGVGVAPPPMAVELADNGGGCGLLGARGRRGTGGSDVSLGDVIEGLGLEGV
jgi:hypothetical protein